MINAVVEHRCQELKGGISGFDIDRRAITLLNQPVEVVDAMLAEHHELGNAVVQDGGPAHKRSPLLSPTPVGLAAVRQIAPQQAGFAPRLVDAFGHKHFQQLAAVSEALDDVQP